MKILDIKGALKKIDNKVTKRTNVTNSLAKLKDGKACQVNGTEMLDDVCRRRIEMALTDYAALLTDEINILKRSIGVS